jgi:chromosome segregation ATPase
MGLGPAVVHKVINEQRGPGSSRSFVRPNLPVTLTGLHVSKSRPLCASLIMDDMDEDLEVLELIQSKEGSLDAFKNEWTDLEKSIETILSNNLDKEREVDFQNGELKTVRDQLAFARRNVDELVSQQEVLKETIEHINQKRDGLVERESKNREEIGVFQGYFSELKDALRYVCVCVCVYVCMYVCVYLYPLHPIYLHPIHLYSVGADWAPDQLEQRIVLEKERDFLSSKLENSNNQLAGMRGEIDHIYSGIQQLEGDNLELDKELSVVEGKRYTVKKESSNMVSRKEELEREIHDQRAVVVSVEAEIAEKHSMKRAEDRALKSLDVSIAKSKSQMEIYISNYDTLYRTLQETTQVQ